MLVHFSTITEHMESKIHHVHLQVGKPKISILLCSSTLFIHCMCLPLAFSQLMPVLFWPVTVRCFCIYFLKTKMLFVSECIHNFAWFKQGAYHILELFRWLSWNYFGHMQDKYSASLNSVFQMSVWMLSVFSFRLMSVLCLHIQMYAIMVAGIKNVIEEVF